jgi:small conductance mechanosensitive channel
MDPELLAEACGSDPSWICREILDATDGNESLARTADFLLARPLTIVLIVVGAVIVNRLLRRAIGHLVERVAAGDRPGMVRSVIDKAPDVLTGPSLSDPRAASRARTLGLVLRSVASSVVFSVALLLVLGEVGVNLGPLLAGAGIAGVAVGFGAQSLVKDFLSGIFMLLEDQYGVGDVVDLGEAVGEVEAVSLRSTRLRDGQGTVWHVPNGEIRRVGNMSQQWAKAVVDVAVAYGTDVRAATEVIRSVGAALRDDQGWADKVLEDAEVLGVEALGADGVTIRVTVKTQPGQQWAVNRELRLRLREALDEAGIDAPYQRTKAVGADAAAGAATAAPPASPAAE